MPHANDLSKRVTGLIKRHGSVNACAKAIGIPQSTLDRIARGERGLPRTETLQLIAEFFDTSVDWLITGQGRPPSESHSWNIIPQAEAKLWDKLIRSLSASPELLSALASLPKAAMNATFNLPLALIRESGEDYERNEPELRRRYRDAIAHEYLAWIGLLETWLEVFGKERTLKVLTRYIEEVARGFRTPARASGLTVEPSSPRTARKKRSK